MGQKWGFCRRVKGVRFNVHFLSPKGPFLGVPHPLKSILATGLPDNDVLIKNLLKYKMHFNIPANQDQLNSYGCGMWYPVVSGVYMVLFLSTKVNV